TRVSRVHQIQSLRCERVDDPKLSKRLDGTLTQGRQSELVIPLGLDGETIRRSTRVDPGESSPVSVALRSLDENAGRIRIRVCDITAGFHDERGMRRFPSNRNQELLPRTRGIRLPARNVDESGDVDRSGRDRSDGGSLAEHHALGRGEYRQARSMVDESEAHLVDVKTAVAHLHEPQVIGPVVSDLLQRT